jgi:mRNA-degrading endonuclease toxin of MazEF toxin-antitoxin module
LPLLSSTTYGPADFDLRFCFCIALSFILERCIIVHRWHGGCYRPIETFGSQHDGNHSPILVTYTASGEGHYDGLVPMEPIPGAGRSQRSRRKVKRFGQVDEERMMLADMLQTLSSEKQTQRVSPTDLMGATRDRVTVLRRVMENNGSAHLNTIRSLEERMKSTRVTMLASDICDELTRALRPMTECG